MSLDQIRELHYITPLENVNSIIANGILSHNEAITTDLKKRDISMNGVQKLRATKVIPASCMGQEKTIHECTNFYFNAKNPMLFSLKKENHSICVLRLLPNLLQQPGATISDQNAACNEARFYKAAEGVQHLALNILFGQYWTSNRNTPETNKAQGQKRCAELLLPNAVHPSNIGGIYVVSETVKQAILDKFPEGCPVPITVRPTFFFTEGIDEAIPLLDNKRFPPPVERVVIDLTHEEVKPKPVVKIEAVKTIIEEKKTYTPPPPKKKGILKWLNTQAAQQQEIVLPNNCSIKSGDLLKSECQTLVNTVNCKGVMGKGIALSFKNKFNDMYKSYVSLCEQKKVKPGVPYIYNTAEGKIILNFPTKDHWKNGSDLDWIRAGLQSIKQNYREWGITSLALPPLGCGNGGLDWNVVRAMIFEILGGIDIAIELYRPE